MEISYLGNGSVRIATRHVAIVSDPLKGAGKKSTADVTLLTALEDDREGMSGLQIDSPGEYEVKEVMITGVPVQLHVDESGERGAAYVLETDELSIGILGNVAPQLGTEAAEALSELDALVVPVGGHGLTLDATAAVELIGKLEPKYVFPVHYANAGSKYEVPQDDLKKFLDEMGVSNAEAQAKFKMNPRDLPEETTVVVLEANA